MTYMIAPIGGSRRYWPHAKLSMTAIAPGTPACFGEARGSAGEAGKLQQPQREPGATRARVRATPYGNAYPHHQYPPTECIPIDDMMRLCQHGAPVRALGAPRAPPAVPWTQPTASACPTRPMPAPPTRKARRTRAFHRRYGRGTRDAAGD